MLGLVDLVRGGVVLDSVYCCDCLDGLGHVGDGSVDLVLTDPPYFLDWKPAIKFRDRKDIYHHGDDTQGWDRTSDISGYYAVLFSHFRRVLRVTGSVVIFCRVENISYLKESAVRAGFEYRATVCWHKTNPPIQVRKVNYISSFETLCWLTVAVEGGGHGNGVFNFKLQREMHNFMETPICMGGERTEHPTQKPLRLVRHFLEIHSNAGDVVLDPFCGSGTVACACRELGRRYICMERDERYVLMSERRLLNTMGSLF